jgi:hypothetical protein
LGDIDEEYELCNYSFSSKAPTAQSISQQEKLPESPNERIIGSEYYPEASDGGRKPFLSPNSVGHTFATYPVSRASINLALPSQTMRGPSEATKPVVENSHLLSSDHEPDGRNTIGESLVDERMSSLDLGKKAGDKRMERPQEKSRDLESHIDQPSARMRDPAEKSESLHLTMNSIKADQPADEKLDFCMYQHREVNKPELCAPSTSSHVHRVMTSESGAEEFIAALARLDVESKMSTSIPALKSSNDQLSLDSTSEPQGADNLDFVLMAHSVFGTGSWIEEDDNDLSNLDVEGLCEVYTMSNDMDSLEIRFGDGWKSSLRNRGDSAVSGSSPENYSGGNSSNSGSRKGRQSGSNGGIGHNKRLSEDGDGMEDGGDPDQSKKAKTDKRSEKRFKCPFHAHDSKYFRTSIEHGNKYITCAAGRGFLDIPRLK